MGGVLLVGVQNISEEGILGKEFTGTNAGVQTKACQKERTANPTAKKVNCRGIRKTMAGTWGRIEGAQARALVQHAFTSWQNWGVFWPAGALLSFLPSSEPLHLRHLNMSFAGARHFVASKNTFYEAKTVSGMFSHQAS